MSRCIIIFVVIFLSGCSCLYRGPLHKEHCPRATDQQLAEINYAAVTDIVFRYAAMLKRDNHLTLCNSFVRIDEKVNKIHLEFSTLDLLELQEARGLLVDVVEGLLYRVNNSPDVSCSLSHRPFEPEDLEIIFRFESFYGLFLDRNYMGRINMRRGEVTYSSFKLYDTMHDPWDCKRESYALSRQLVGIDRSVYLPYLERHESSEHSAAPIEHFRERYYGPACPMWDCCPPLYPSCH